MQKSEVRGSRTAGTANSRTDRHGRTRTVGEGRGRRSGKGTEGGGKGSEAGAERARCSLKHTGARPVDGAGGGGCAVAVGRRLCFTGRV